MSRNCRVALLAVLVSHCARTGLQGGDDCVAGDVGSCEVAGSSGSSDAGTRDDAGPTSVAGSVGEPPSFGGQVAQGGLSGVGGTGQGGTGQGGLASAGAGAGAAAGGSAGKGGQTNGGSAGSTGGAPDGGSAGSSAGAPGVTCDDGAELELYVLSSENVVHQLDPETLDVLSQHQLQTSNPNSLAMTTDGTLFLSGWFGDIHTVDPLSGATQQTSFDPTPGGFTARLCIGWANSLPQAPQGTLLINRVDALGHEIYSLDPNTFQYAFLGRIDVQSLEIVGNEQGRLFALTSEGISARIIEVDSSSFQVVDQVVLPGNGWSSYDIAYAGALYTFGSAGSGSPTLAHRIGAGSPLQDQPQLELGSLDFAVIGAGARVCP